VRETGAEQFVRDARIAMIYEGTNGIQALDLVGRKLGADGGRAITAFLAMAGALVRDDGGNAALKAGFLDPLGAALADLTAAIGFFMKHGARHPEDALAGAHDFLHLLGHVCLGVMWVRMATASFAALDAASSPAGFLEAKLSTGRHYMGRLLPATALHRSRIEAGGETVMALEAAAF